MQIGLGTFLIVEAMVEDLYSREGIWSQGVQGSNQLMVAHSSNEAKYWSLVHALSKLNWTKSMLREMGMNVEFPSQVWCDTTWAPTTWQLTRSSMQKPSVLLFNITLFGNKLKRKFQRQSLSIQKINLHIH